MGEQWGPEKLVKRQSSTALRIPRVPVLQNQKVRTPATLPKPSISPPTGSIEEAACVNSRELSGMWCKPCGRTLFSGVCIVRQGMGTKSPGYLDMAPENLPLNRIQSQNLEETRSDKPLFDGPITFRTSGKTLKRHLGSSI